MVIPKANQTDTLSAAGIDLNWYHLFGKLLHNIYQMLYKYVYISSLENQAGKIIWNAIKKYILKDVYYNINWNGKITSKLFSRNRLFKYTKVYWNIIQPFSSMFIDFILPENDRTSWNDSEKLSLEHPSNRNWSFKTRKLEGKEEKRKQLHHEGY